MFVKIIEVKSINTDFTVMDAEFISILAPTIVTIIVKKRHQQFQVCISDLVSADFNPAE